MAYQITDTRIGLPYITSITSIATTTLNIGQFPVGTLVKAKDPTYGEGEFILLAGVANLTVGQMVTYNPLSGLTVLTPNTANLAQPIAVAMAANTSATALSWFQIEGAAVIKKTATKVGVNVAMFQSATTGRIMATIATGKQILGARSIPAATVASATSTVTVLINRPHIQGQII